MNDGTTTYKDKYDIDKIDVWHRSCSMNGLKPTKKIKLQSYMILCGMARKS